MYHHIHTITDVDAILHNLEVQGDSRLAKEYHSFNIVIHVPLMEMPPFDATREGIMLIKEIIRYSVRKMFSRSRYKQYHSFQTRIVFDYPLD